jgi:hypothetical protein
MASKLKSLTSKSKGKGEKEKRVTIEEIENGYIITQNIEWKEPRKDGGTEWKYETKKWFSETNPLESAEKPLADLID